MATTYYDRVKAGLIEGYIDALRRCSSRNTQACHAEAQRIVTGRFPGITAEELVLARRDAEASMDAARKTRNASRNTYMFSGWNDNVDPNQPTRYTYQVTVEVEVRRGTRRIGVETRLISFFSSRQLTKGDIDSRAAAEGLALVQRQIDTSPDRFGRNIVATKTINTNVEGVRREQI